MSDEGKSRGYNYPVPQKVEVPYEQPDAPTNPVVRGLLLYYGAKLISSSSLLRHYLWRNAGFADIRLLPGLDKVEPRYDPTVIPSSINSSRITPSSDTTTPRDNLDSPSRFYTVHGYHKAYTTGATTPTQLISNLLPLIRRDASSPTPHAIAWVQLRIDLISAAAAQSTERHRAGKPLSILDGVPIAIKDQADLAGYHKTLGSAHNLAAADVQTSWCVKQWEDAGAIILGKLNMHELGLDTTNNNPVHGTPRNPYHSSYYTGGSSGGSGYAVAAGIVPITLGADGGGSIRVPSAFCGVFGLKTSHGRVSSRPTVNLASTTSVTGPLAANMTDLEIAYRVMATPDPHNSLSSMFPPPSPTPQPNQTKNKILGLYQPWFDRADPAVLNACHAALTYLTSQKNYTIHPITLPHLPAGQKAHALTILSEISSAHHPNVGNFTPANQVLLSVGSCATAADFMAAQRLRNLIMKHLAALFQEYPGMVIVSPTTPNAGCRIGDDGGGELAYGISDGNTAVRTMEYVWLANFSGCPALSAPVGYFEPGGGGGGGILPTALMGMAEWGAEDTLLEFGYDVERYLNEEVGRKRPGGWVDVLGLAGGNGAGDGDGAGDVDWVGGRVSVQ